VDVADGDSECVGGVSGLGRLVQVEQPGDHELYLLLSGEAIADDGALDGERSVLGNEQTAVGCGQHGDAADLAEFKRALGVGREEDFFDGDDLGLPELEQCGEFGVDLEQADGGAVLLVQANGPGAEGTQLRNPRGVVDFYDTVAGELRSAVDPEDSHADQSTARAGSQDGQALCGI